MNNEFQQLHRQLNYMRAIGKIIDDDWQKGAQKIGITQSEQHILWILYFEKKAPMSRIAELGLWDLSTVMQIIKRLKAKGLVNIIKDEKDLRISYCVLTEEGKQKREESTKLHLRVLDFLKDYVERSEENKIFIEKMREFQQELNSHFYGADFVQWVEKTGKMESEKDT